MNRTHRATVVCGLIFSMTGCATVSDQQWYQETKQVSVKTASTVANATTETFKHVQHYLEEKDVLKTFHDAGEHSEAAVLEVLHKSKARSSAGASTPGAHGANPSGGAKGASTPGTPANVPERYAGNLRWPVDVGVVSSEFGERWGKPHKGIDIAGDAGDPVYAVADADVIYAGDGLRGYGNVVILRHDAKLTTLYAHNRELKVHLGDHVTKGTLISLLGNTGHSTGPHVHFEIREGDTAVNPRTRLPPSMRDDVVGARTGVANARH
jgi:murein DD-endopeptidase MepM/ murein hydrolase activator NlpD